MLRIISLIMFCSSEERLELENTKVLLSHIGLPFGTVVGIHQIALERQFLHHHLAIKIQCRVAEPCCLSSSTLLHMKQIRMHAESRIRECGMELRSINYDYFPLLGQARKSNCRMERGAPCFSDHAANPAAWNSGS